MRDVFTRIADKAAARLTEDFKFARRATHVAGHDHHAEGAADFAQIASERHQHHVARKFGPAKPFCGTKFKAHDRGVVKDRLHRIRQFFAGSRLENGGNGQAAHFGAHEVVQM